MPRAEKDLDGFRGRQLEKFEKLILSLAETPRPRQATKLSGSAGMWRVRTGDYRVLYEIDEAHRRIRVWRIAHRKEVYR